MVSHGTLLDFCEPMNTNHIDNLFSGAPLDDHNHNHILGGMIGQMPALDKNYSTPFPFS